MTQLRDHREPQTRLRCIPHHQVSISCIPTTSNSCHGNPESTWGESLQISVGLSPLPPLFVNLRAVEATGPSAVQCVCGTAYCTKPCLQSSILNHNDCTSEEERHDLGVRGHMRRRAGGAGGELACLPKQWLILQVLQLLTGPLAGQVCPSGQRSYPTG